MCGAGGVDDQTIGRIDSDDRRVALQRPFGELLQAGLIFQRFGVTDHQVWDQRLRLRCRHTDAEPGRLCSSVQGKHLPPAATAAR